MDFDVSKVYTAVNADELHEGDLVFATDILSCLKKEVTEEEYKPKPIAAILPEKVEYRFSVGEMSNTSGYALAYLVCPARNAVAYKAWREGMAVEIQTEEGWTEVDFDALEADSDCWLFQNLRVKKSSTHYRPYRDVEELVSDFKERFSNHIPAYAMPLVWVQRKDKNEKFLITGFTSTEENGELVKIGRGYYGLGVLFDHYTFLNGSPCGVQETNNADISIEEAVV